MPCWVERADLKLILFWVHHPDTAVHLDLSCMNRGGGAGVARDAGVDEGRVCPAAGEGGLGLGAFEGADLPVFLARFFPVTTVKSLPSLSVSLVSAVDDPLPSEKSDDSSRGGLVSIALDGRLPSSVVAEEAGLPGRLSKAERLAELLGREVDAWDAGAVETGGLDAGGEGAGQTGSWMASPYNSLRSLCVLGSLMITLKSITPAMVTG